MYALQIFCRWISFIVIFKILIGLLVFSFILALPTRYYSVTEEIPVEPREKTIDVYSLVSEKDIICLADNIFFEAGNQSDLGKKAVAYVTINRLLSINFPDTLCNIVYQRKGNVCQFSWACKHKSLIAKKTREKEMWERSLSIAHDVIYSYHFKNDPTAGALFFHADYVRPFWSKTMLATIIINNHIFYRPIHGT
jgi:spore germination cell wall hydrolase CwlJ-like protein